MQGKNLLVWKVLLDYFSPQLTLSTMGHIHSSACELFQPSLSGSAAFSTEISGTLLYPVQVNSQNYNRPFTLFQGHAYKTLDKVQMAVQFCPPISDANNFGKASFLMGGGGKTKAVQGVNPNA